MICLKGLQNVVFMTEHLWNIDKGEVLHMKKEFNRAVSSMINVNEVELFREMAKQFNYNKFTRATYVEEVHQRYVEFNSSFQGGTKKVELGDLLFLTYNKSQKELKMCVLQAKYRSKPYKKFLDCDADIFQWELLYYRPDVYNKSKMNIPKHILNFRNDFKSITAYGIFYHDKMSNEIDFLYTLPELFSPKRMMPNPSKVFSFTCPNLGGCKITCCGCGTGCLGKKGAVPWETLYTCAIDVFENEVLSWRIGAPINDSEIKKYILGLLQSMRRDADDREVIDEILRDQDFETDSEHFNNEDAHPSAVIVITETA